MKKATFLGLTIAPDSSDRWFWERGRVLVFVLLGFTAFNYIYNGLFRPLSTEQVDFIAYYNAALAFRHGLPVYEHMIRFFEQGVVNYEGPFPYVYPPGFVLFLSPFAYVTFKQASLFWNLLNNVCFFFSLILLMKTIKQHYSRLEWITLVFVSMNFTPLFLNYLVGQCNIILLFLITLGLHFYRSNRSICVGIVLALATTVKVIPGLLIGFMLWKRQYKAFLSAVLGLLLIFAYSLLFFDVDLHLWYFKFMAHQNLFDAYHDNHSVTGFFSRFLVHSVWGRAVSHSPILSQVCIVVTSALMLFVLLYVTRKGHNNSGERSLREYALVVVTMLLTSRMTSTPYLVMLLLPVAILVHELFQKRVANRWMYPLAAAYGVIAIWYPLPVGKFLDMDVYRIFMRGPQAHIFSVQFFALMVFWAYFAFAPLPIGTNPAGHGAHGETRLPEGPEGTLRAL